MVSDNRVAEAVLHAVASHEGVGEKALEQTLYEVVDPDALEALYDHSSARSTKPTVSFEYHGYTVVVESPKQVEVQPETSSN